MGREKDFLIMEEDYRSFIFETLHEMDAIRTCVFCGAYYLTGKDESLIYGTVTNAFKKKYEMNYDNKLMKKLIKQILNEGQFGHSCDK